MSAAAMKKPGASDLCGMEGLCVAEAQGATEDQLLSDAAGLLSSGIACLDGLCEIEGAEVHDLHWPAMRMLRQAAFALEMLEGKRLQSAARQIGGAA